MSRPGERAGAAGAFGLLRPSDPRHGTAAQLLLSWAPLALVLLGYLVADWVSEPIGTGLDEGSPGANRLGLPLQVAGPAALDRAVFGVVPTVWLQEHLVGDAARWYDVPAALVYVTHFLAIPVLTAVVWFRVRERFAAWLVAVLGFALVGLLGYVVYPAAPPWLASLRGEVGPVERISDRGWEVMALDPVGVLTVLGQQGSNPVAAMPSLHAGAALLVALAAWPWVGRVWRGTLVAYAVAMALVLVYTGEHYVSDVVAGWATAVVALSSARWWERRRARRRASRPDSPPPPRRAASSAASSPVG